MEDFQLHPWTVQPSLNQLRKHGESRQLGPRSMAILVFLAQRAGKTVSKDELTKHAWEGAFTSDEALTTAIYELRKALDDDARRPRFIATVRGKGYRLLGDVEWQTGSTPQTVPVTKNQVPTPSLAPPSNQGPPPNQGPLKSWEGSPASAGLDHAPSSHPTSSAPIPRAGRLWPATLVLSLALLAALWWSFSHRPHSAPNPAGSPDSSEIENSTVFTPEGPEADSVGLGFQHRPICSVAVLPLDSLSPDAESLVFAQGLSEQLALDLALGGYLEVVPGYSSVSAGRASAELDTDAVVEGSVQPSADRLWIRLQMVDSLDGRLLWGGSFDRPVGDSLQMQRHLAREMAGQILARMQPSGCRDRPSRPESTPSTE